LPCILNTARQARATAVAQAVSGQMKDSAAQVEKSAADKKAAADKKVADTQAATKKKIDDTTAPLTAPAQK